MGRIYEVKFGTQTEFAIVPGEEPLLFELLRTKVAQEWAPEGPVEEDLVLTVAKCIWRKQRFQRFNTAKYVAAMFDPESKAYDEPLALNGFRQLLEIETEEHEIKRALQGLGGYFEYHLTTECPQPEFDSVAAWIEALKVEIDTVLMPAATRLAGPPPCEVLLERSAAVFDDEHFARELEFEGRIDATLQRALDQLVKIKAAKRLITFRERQRFVETHQGRSVGNAVVKRLRQSKKESKDETR